jgi:Leucine-rich repeat (LRR) protein
MKLLIAFLWLLFLSYTKTVVAQARLSRNQYSALKLLYDSTNGDHWTWIRPIRNNSTVWNFTSNSDPCQDRWQGLTCTNLTPRVFVINRILLARYNLSGSIPATFFENMRSLQLINFFRNQISGTLPSTVGILSNLELLILERNSMSGTLPSTLGNLSSLQGLNLRFNGFSGTIPTTLGLLTNLGNLTYSQELPGLFNFSGPTNEEFYNGGILIAYTKISGTVPTELCNLFQIETLFLENNCLVGTIPSEIGNLKSIQNLHLSLNSMTGTLPSKIGQLTNLRSLWLFNNSFIGSIPESFGNLTNLLQFIVFNNSLNSTLPSILGSLTRLNYVQLYNNKFTGSLPDLSRLSLMSVFDIGINSFTGTIPSYIGNNWTRLVRFTLSSKGNC